ncbi:MAG TPA: hypothetical protein VNF74_07530 [Terriglobales bacterium]|nr:hypothetical protein [Terriglobales bacterium]
MGQYGGEVGAVYIEPKSEPGRYDREVFLVLKEFLPSFSRGGDMAQDILIPAVVVPLQTRGEAAMNASLAKGMPHGYEVGYDAFTINGKVLGAGEPVRVKAGERVLFHIVNGSATEIRSLALPGHEFEVVALDGNRDGVRRADGQAGVDGAAGGAVGKAARPPRIGKEPHPPAPLLSQNGSRFSSLAGAGPTARLPASRDRARPRCD